MRKKTELYDAKGWVHIPDIVSKELVRDLKLHSLDIRSKSSELSDWKGVPCAGKVNSFLREFYTSKLMYDVATSILGDTVYLFNDQVVCKYSNETDFVFEPHYDNFFGPNSDGKIHTVNCCVILDDFTEENGALSVRNKDDGEWITLYPTAGDIVAVNGNTYHKSGVNRSESHRCLYACVYADDVIYYDTYYTNRFVL